MLAPPLGCGSVVAGAPAEGCAAGDGPNPDSVGGTAVGSALGEASGCRVGPGVTGAALGGEVGTARGLGIGVVAELLLTGVSTVVLELEDGPPAQDAAGRPVSVSAPIIAPMAIANTETVARTGPAQAGTCRARPPGAGGRGRFGSAAGGRPWLPR